MLSWVMMMMTWLTDGFRTTEGVLGREKPDIRGCREGFGCANSTEKR